MKKIVINSELFATGRILREPPGSQSGYWVGAPGAYFSIEEKAMYLTYRIRRPRGIAPDRGGEARIARSTDREHYEDIWTVTKDRFSTASIERCALRRGPDGLWRYFVSMVDPADGRWCVEVLKATRPDNFDPIQARRLFSAETVGLEGIKDPWIREISNGFEMFLSVAMRTPKTSDTSHATLDIFNTGDCVSVTALATSRDLDNWDWQGVVFAPSGPGWDSYCRRLNCVVPGLGAFYDGSASEKENYEEKTGLAVAAGPQSWKTATPDGPLLTSPYSSNSLRYVDVAAAEGRLHFFYEFARMDGAHELRSLSMDAGAFSSGT
jgi:hypothetical protein